MKEKLYKTVSKIREIIEETPIQDRPDFWDKFPYGCCGDITEILGEYLTLLHNNNFEHVIGWQAGCTHAWLEIDDLIIDITSDQFNTHNQILGSRPKIYVNIKDEWYSKWEITTRHNAGICRKATNTNQLLKFLEKIKNKLI